MKNILARRNVDFKIVLTIQIIYKNEIQKFLHAWLQQMDNF
jgi:hypothetical protein